MTHSDREAQYIKETGDKTLKARITLKEKKMPKEIYEERQAEINRQIREGELTMDEVMLASDIPQYDENNLE